jgi:hypothetical protein
MGRNWLPASTSRTSSRGHGPEVASELVLSAEPVRIAEVVLRSAFDVNRHSYACVDAVASVGG